MVNCAAEPNFDSMMLEVNDFDVAGTNARAWCWQYPAWKLAMPHYDKI
jgi:hypothetical protein